MNTPESNQRRELLDDATSRRLAKLGTTPVDSSQLLRAIETQIPRSQVRKSDRRMIWLKSPRAVAASLLLFGLIAAMVIHSSGGPVLASAITLARIHGEVLHHDGSHVAPVNSIGTANAMLAGACPGLAVVPELPEYPVMSCCVHEMGRKKIACVAIQVDGIMVSMAVAEAADVKLPPCATVTINGVNFHVQSHEDINMVMTERGGRWVCLMGKLPINRLAEVATSLRF